MIGNDTINNGNSQNIWLVVVLERTNETSLSLNIRSALNRSMGIPQVFFTKISFFFNENFNFIDGFFKKIIIKLQLK